MLTDSAMRCPRDGKRLVLDAGQDDVTGELVASHSCLHCGYTEHSPRRVSQAAKSPTVTRAMTPLRELLQRQRLEGVVVPMDLKYEAFEEAL